MQTIKLRNLLQQLYSICPSHSATTREGHRPICRSSMPCSQVTFQQPVRCRKNLLIIEWPE